MTSMELFGKIKKQHDLLNTVHDYKNDPISIELRQRMTDIEDEVNTIQKERESRKPRYPAAPVESPPKQVKIDVQQSTFLNYPNFNYKIMKEEFKGKNDSPIKAKTPDRKEQIKKTEKLRRTQNS